MIIDERGYNLTSKPTIIDGRGETPSKLIVYKSRNRNQKSVFWNLHGGPAGPAGAAGPASPAEVVSLNAARTLLLHTPGVSMT